MNPGEIKKQATTLDDVAKRAGVSKYTVSAVLNRTQSNTRVSDATRERIEQAAAELNYRPNAIAVSLRRRRTDLIGFYNAYSTTDARNRFLAEILAGMQHGALDWGKDIVLFRNLKGQSEDTIYNALADGRVDGLILYAPADDALAARLADSHLPVIAVADALPSLPSVVIDDYAGGALQATHLAEKGHRHVLYRAAVHKTRSLTGRFNGFWETAHELGLKVSLVCVRATAGLTDEERALLTGPPGSRPTGAACWEDWHADQLVAACKAEGIAVPGELAVIGFDGLEASRVPAWELTTIRAPWMQVAERAIALLQDQVKGRSVPAETTLPVELVYGDTT